MIEIKRCSFAKFCLLGACLIAHLFSSVGTNAIAEEISIEETANTIFKAFSKTSQLEDALIVNATSAVAVQDYFIALLRPTWGMDVGYAAASSDDAAKPLTGVLLENMFTGTRAIIDRSYGIQMQASAELLFRVGSDDLNVASDRIQALAALDSVIPGVRLSDVILAGDGPHDFAVYSAANLQIRMCVLGGELKLDSEVDWMNRLAEYSVVLYDENKDRISDYEHTTATHPLDAVLLMVDALAERGILVRKNDLLALGPLTDGVAVGDLSRLRAVFHGLSEDQQVSVYMGFR